MNKIFFVALVLISPLQSGGQNTDSIGQILEGKWECIGFYINDQPLYDTLNTEIEDDFEPEASTITKVYLWKGSVIMFIDTKILN